MNASFRTAFWAMCLGLTVPMVLLVGVELTSGRSARKSSLAAAESTGSLRSQWERATLKSARRDTAGKNMPGKSATRSEVPSTVPARHDPGDEAVVLSPELEVDLGAAGSEVSRDRRIPAVAAGNRMNIDVLPDEVAASAASGRDDREIAARLANIQSRLDRLGRAIAEQPLKESPSDPVQQAASLLKHLQQARELDKVAAQFPILTGSGAADAGGDPPAGGSPATSAKSVETSGNVFDPSRSERKKPRLFSKIYRPRYLSAANLRALAAPLLTPGIGRLGASDADVDEPGRAAGGGTPSAPVAAVVVRDYADVLRKIDRLVKELDVPPVRVLVEASVVTIGVDRETPQGIDLQQLNAAGRAFVLTPAEGIAASPLGAALQGGGIAAFPGAARAALTHGAGLKCGVLKGDPRAFLATLCSAAQTRRVNSWQINGLDRQTIDIILNETADAKGATATVLKLRPIVAPDGLVQLDLRRDNQTERAGPEAVVHQIVLREGQTAVVGGFFADGPFVVRDGAPVIGHGLPADGMPQRPPAGAEPRETIVILTPHVIRTSLLESSQMRGSAVSDPTIRGRPIVQHASALSPATTTAPESRNLGKSIQPLRPARGNTILKSTSGEMQPKRLSAGAVASARPIDGEVSSRDGSADLDDIPVLEISTDNEHGPAVGRNRQE